MDVLITGAASGIGRSVVDIFLENNHKDKSHSKSVGNVGQKIYCLEKLSELFDGCKSKGDEKRNYRWKRHGYENKDEGVLKCL